MTLTMLMTREKKHNETYKSVKWNNFPNIYIYFLPLFSDNYWTRSYLKKNKEKLFTPDEKLRRRKLDKSIENHASETNTNHTNTNK